MMSLFLEPSIFFYVSRNLTLSFKNRENEKENKKKLSLLSAILIDNASSASNAMVSQVQSKYIFSSFSYQIISFQYVILYSQETIQFSVGRLLL